MKRWYALMLKPRQEFATRDRLSQHWHTYLPVTLIDRRFKRNDRRETECLFPAYCFIQLDSGTDDFHPVTKVPGVNKFVRLTRLDGYLHPTPVKDEFIHELQSYEDEKGVFSMYQTEFKSGDSVRFKGGMMKDRTGIIEKLRYRSGKDRAIILLTEIGRTIEVEIKDIEAA
jgi:transcription antitermination factor NusG